MLLERLMKRRISLAHRQRWGAAYLRPKYSALANMLSQRQERTGKLKAKNTLLQERGCDHEFGHQARPEDGSNVCAQRRIQPEAIRGVHFALQRAQNNGSGIRHGQDGLHGREERGERADSNAQGFFCPRFTPTAFLSQEHEDQNLGQSIQLAFVIGITFPR